MGDLFMFEPGSLLGEPKALCSALTLHQGTSNLGLSVWMRSVVFWAHPKLLFLGTKGLQLLCQPGSSVF